MVVATVAVAGEAESSTASAPDSVPGEGTVVAAVETSAPPASPASEAASPPEAALPESASPPESAEPEPAESERRNPSRRNPSRRNPSRRNPSRRNPSRRNPSRRNPSRRNPSRRNPSQRNPSRRNPSRRNPSRRNPSRRNPSRRNPSRRNPSRRQRGLQRSRLQGRRRATPSTRWQPAPRPAPPGPDSAQRRVASQHEQYGHPQHPGIRASDRAPDHHVQIRTALARFSDSCMQISAVALPCGDGHYPDTRYLRGRLRGHPASSPRCWPVDPGIHEEADRADGERTRRRRALLGS